MGMQVGSSGGVKCEINVTPLIDVVLVLLIIFMVITPMLTKGHPVPLPQAHDPAKKPDDKNDIILTVKRGAAAGEKLLFLAVPEEEMTQTPLPEEAVRAKLEELFQAKPSAPMYIKADRSLDYGTVKKAMLLCESAGFRGVSLVAEARKQ